MVILLNTVTDAPKINVSDTKRHQLPHIGSHSRARITAVWHGTKLYCLVTATQCLESLRDSKMAESCIQRPLDHESVVITIMPHHHAALVSGHWSVVSNKSKCRPVCCSFIPSSFRCQFLLTFWRLASPAVSSNMEPPVGPRLIPAAVYKEVPNGNRSINRSTYITAVFRDIFTNNNNNNNNNRHCSLQLKADQLRTVKNNG